MKTYDKKAFGNRLRAARKKVGITSEEVATKLDFCGVTVRYWECGRSTPTLQTLCQLADMLGVSVGWLAAGEGGMMAHEEG